MRAPSGSPWGSCTIRSSACFHHQGTVTCDFPLQSNMSNNQGTCVPYSQECFAPANCDPTCYRSLWAEACATDEKDAILGVQQARNAMTACTYLATISVALATAGLTIIFDDSKIQRIRALAENDPIMHHLYGPPLVPPTVIIALALGSLYLSFVCFAQVSMWGIATTCKTLWSCAHVD